jgi:Protein of unknown function (DUF1579)
MLSPLPAIFSAARADVISTPAVPPFVKRGLPGPFHEVLKSLEGEWLVEKRIYIAIGTRDKPAVSSNMVSRRQWVGGGKHLLDITEGSIGASPYYRLGVLGFSNMDHRYEWSTFDGLNSNRMIYRSAPSARPSRTITLTGGFTDQGLLGEETVSKTIAMRTVIQIEDDDRHLIELYFTPPDRPEILIDRSIYTRIKH